MIVRSVHLGHWIVATSLVSVVVSAAVAAELTSPSNGDPPTESVQAIVEPTNTDSNGHWSYQPILHSHPPSVDNVEWTRGAIDRFVLTRQETLDIKPSPEADRSTLIRRLHLDLIGLPPTPEEVAAFASDNRADAYERLVDRLLASPHYGERWGRHWLDHARYADSDGYDTDRPRPHVWRYRHWVIDAMNRDLPFDQFTIEQLAGDLLDDPTNDQLVATGFHRNTLRNIEPGAPYEEDRVKRTVDRTNTTATVWLGMTLGCAQCHEHRYDPISHEEYYGFYAFFNSLRETTVSAPVPNYLLEFERKMEAFDRDYDPIVAQLKALEAQAIPTRQAAWEAKLPELQAAVWSVPQIAKAIASQGEQLVLQDDGSLLAEGPTPFETTYTIVAETELPSITAIKLEVLPHPSLPQKGPGRDTVGDFDLNSIEVMATPVTDHGPRPLPPGFGMPSESLLLTNPVATFASTGHPISDVLGYYRRNKGWSIGPKVGERHVAVFELAEPIRNPGGTRLEFSLHQGAQVQFGTIGRFRLSVTDATRPFLIKEIPGTPADILKIAESDRSEAQRLRLHRYFCSLDTEWSRLEARRTQMLSRRPADPRTTMARVVAELESPRTTCVLHRGEYLEPAEEVQPHTPSVLPALDARGATPDRLDLARWIVDSQNPLTARVVVNRLWQHYFGVGIVMTDDDFGSHGEAPSHPLLLDWLASQLVNNEWSMKSMHRSIVNSATYRQAARYRPELESLDPNNRLLARQSRLRVEAEVARDLALAVSDRLNTEIGGPSIVLAQPMGKSELTFSRSKPLVPAEGAQQNRRGMYVWFQRTAPNPMLTIFDASNSNVSCTKRERSVSPLQSLVRLNDPVFTGCAAGLAERVLSYGVNSDDPDTIRDQRLDVIYRVCLSRSPNANELSNLRELYDQQHKFYALNGELAQYLCSMHGIQPPKAHSPADAATWFVIARVVMNLEEFLVRE